MNKKTKTITVRLSNDVIEYVNENAGESRSNFVEKALKSYRDIDTICMWSGISAEDFCEQIKDMFMLGKITIAEGKIVEDK